ncbi:hypothetical protein F511_14520 [Dorcoceras hygrometricum]|uniref:Uncharacterized protein n=1 Tax=Dorcoceras hygrometricum TaxID=472368 RepID=A0A2Z7BN12_9LAMI|nr:hypothetical protein F511_14520 [Dorcoceras hygrometricum]
MNEGYQESSVIKAQRPPPVINISINHWNPNSTDSDSNHNSVKELDYRARQLSRPIPDSRIQSYQNLKSRITTDSSTHCDVQLLAKNSGPAAHSKATRGLLICTTSKKSAQLKLKSSRSKIQHLTSMNSTSEFNLAQASLRSVCVALLSFRCLIQYSTPSDQLMHPGLKVRTQPACHDQPSFQGQHSSRPSFRPKAASILCLHPKLLSAQTAAMDWFALQQHQLVTSAHLSVNLSSFTRSGPSSNYSASFQEEFYQLYIQRPPSCNRNSSNSNILRSVQTIEPARTRAGLD